MTPTHGFIVLGDGERHRVDNDERLRDRVLASDGRGTLGPSPGIRTMINEMMRSELIAMRAEDFGVGAEPAAADELGGPYVPRMEAVHIKKAAGLRELIARHGWPSEDTAGKVGAEAAWSIVQNAVGEPEFQRRALEWVRESSDQGRTPAWHGANLEDRIAMSEGRPPALRHAMARRSP